ncbi:MAG: hypothetical protein CMG59_05085 [Candidatus Marinimicrobia bacterium]|nr:hypothetical protein [Candidatus Neomarinimicrobiota bacterium]
MIKTNFKTSGYILFVSMALTLATTLIISSFMASIPSETLRINMRIAKTKALYNAETGVAQKAYPFMIRSEFTADTTLTGELIQNFSSNYNHDVDMGLYLGPKLSFSDSGERQATVEGVSFIINANGVLDSVKQSVSISARPQTLAKYMYLTESEKAGGAPMSFGGYGQAASEGLDARRFVYFGPDDALEGIVQSNSLVSMSSGGCPDFSNATFYITRPGDDPSLTCDYLDLFQTNNPDDIDTVSTPAVKLPPTGYETLKNNATIFYDSGRKIYNQFGTKDTLIMTEVEFFESGRMNLKQWWYLVPPHLDEDVTNPEDQISSFPRHLDGIDNGDIDCNNGNLNSWCYDTDGDGNSCDNCSTNLFNTICGNTNDLRTCRPYIDSLFFYHGKGYVNGLSNLSNMPNQWYNLQPNQENFIDPNVRGPHGLNQHYDFMPLNSIGQENSSSLLIDAEYFITSPTVLYIKDGPVRVKGFYKGQYTIVTDEYTTYKRHAHNQIASEPEDTIWNNIWIVDDLVNADAKNSPGPGPVNHLHGNLSEFQPNDDCFGGSQNVMGLVSGANVIIANTPENGQRGCGLGGGCNISINAAILALNESFVMHFWQNSTNMPQTLPVEGGRSITGLTNEPPFGDGRGRGQSNNQTTNNDKREEIYLWGSVVQKYRGYMLRNRISNYHQTTMHDIGMDKKYYYDNNLFCTSPPFYPAVEYDDGTGEISVNLTSFRKSN